VLVTNRWAGIAAAAFAAIVGAVVLLVGAYTGLVGSLVLGAVCLLVVVAGLTASRARGPVQSTTWRAESAGFSKGIAVAAIAALVLGAFAIVAFAMWFASSGVQGGY
jgi:polyferredoxin